MKKLIYLALLICVTPFISCKDDDNDNGSNNTALNETDRNFIMMAGYANMAEIDAAQLAMTKATHDSVHMFAMMMTQDHQQAYNELKNIGSDLQVTVPAEPDAAHKQIKQQLMNMNGRAFDSAYMKVQVMDHEKTIGLFENEVRNGKHQRVKDYANKYLPGLRHHLQEARQISDSI